MATSRRAPAAGAVLGAILGHGPVARSTVARLTGLSPAAVSGHSARLVARGLVLEDPETAGPRGLGRPHVPLRIDTGRHLVAGAHIGVTATTLALMDLRGRIVAEERRPYDRARPEPGEVLAGIAARLPDLVRDHAGGRRVLGLGLATGYRVDPRTGVVVDHPALGWREVPAGRLLAAATGLAVHVDSHARALARAEQLIGRTRGADSAALLFVGTVVDAAFTTGGALHSGPRSGAGSVARLPLGGPPPGAGPGVRIHGEDFRSQVSEPALVRCAAARGLAVPGVARLLELAGAGDRTALDVLRHRARLIGSAAATLLDLLDPEILVVVEPGIARFPECLADLRTEVAARSWLCDDPEQAVVPGSFPDQALAVAGTAVALGALYTDPLGPWRPAAAAAG